MKILLLMISSFLMSSVFCQGKKYHFPEVGWTLVLPQGFTVLDSSANAATNARGRKKLEETTGVKTDITRLKTLISATKDRYNYFNATLTPYDPSEHGSFESNFEQMKNLLYQTMKAQLKDAKMDTATTRRIIDGLEFRRFSFKAAREGREISMCILSRLFDGYLFGMTYRSIDGKVTRDLEAMLRNSRFAK